MTWSAAVTNSSAAAGPAWLLEAFEMPLLCEFKTPCWAETAYRLQPVTYMSTWLLLQQLVRALTFQTPRQGMAANLSSAAGIDGLWLWKGSTPLGGRQSPCPLVHLSTPESPSYWSVVVCVALQERADTYRQRHPANSWPATTYVVGNEEQLPLEPCSVDCE
jgi:hypothetical protein